MTKTIRLGNRLRYPLTIVKLLKSPGDRVRKQEPLLQYSFKWMKEVGDTIRGETWKEEQTTVVTWDSPTDGELKQWHVKEGQRIEADRPCMLVKEDCSHEIQFQGLCGICGKDMTEVNWAAETRDTARAPINMVHDHTSLTVSELHAHRTEQDTQRRLLQSRKLSLVVDLDQTIIQACIDPTVGEWQNDPTNPNYESVKEVKSFYLDDGPYGLARRCNYYIKLRPGLEGFLRRVSEMYELHVYTMGTRAYAQNVARVVDPEKKLFGNRVISRDENGNMYAKNLQRLFPVSTRMVVIIDDRSDVWPRNRPNLIKVSPYEFFKGIGDINSSFLPKRQDLLTSDAATNGVGKKRKKKESHAKRSKDDVAALQAIVNITGGDDSALTKRQLEEQERTLEKQITDRPLQVLQEKLDREDEEAEKATVHSDDGSSDSRSSSPAPHRHRVLQDEDEELGYLEQHLTLLHRNYYALYDTNRALHHAGAAVDLSSVPDVGEILDELKAEVLQGFRIVLSGVLPRDVDIYLSEIGTQIMSFGAELREKITDDVTHLVVNASQPGREKLLEARRRAHIKIVSQQWLADCFSRWAPVDETPYLFTARLIDEDEADNKKLADGGPVDGQREERKEANGAGARPKNPRLELISASGETRELADDDDDDDVDEDEDGDGAGPAEGEDSPPPAEDEDVQLTPLEGLRPIDWGEANQELEEFLASGSTDEDEDEDEEDENEEEDEECKEEGDDDEQDDVAEVEDDAGRPSRKRKSRDEEDEVTDAGDESANPQPKRLRRKQSQRTSSLRNQYMAGEEGAADSSLPTPQVTGDEEDGAGSKGGGEGEDEDMDFDEADLEAELEAEFDREFGKVEAEAKAAAAAAAEAREKG